MDSAKNQLVEKLHSANNILVTVSRNPSADQLAACIGLTLVLNKLNKHATAVFSGEVPSTIEFLKPEETLEKNTDSLRDFIIALDKGKADKLRYKVEDQVVRIFITPYRTSISQDDLDFSQGDFNVDLVVALGVQRQEDLDEAITAHGRILHDATVASVNVVPDGGLGSINWNNPQASSLSELVAVLTQGLGENLLDGQIATALLTGIVAQTERFSNEKTSPQTMSISAELMAAGANQQLVATQLEDHEPATPTTSGSAGGAASSEPGSSESSDSPKSDDGTLEIEHDHNGKAPESPETDDKTSQPADTPAPPDTRTDFQKDEDELVLPSLKKPSDEPLPPIILQTQTPAAAPPPDTDTPAPAAEVDAEDVPSTSASKIITEPPQLGGTLTANSQPEGYDPSTDPLSSLTLPSVEQGQGLFSHAGSGSPASSTPPATTPPPAATPTATPPTPAPNSPTPLLTGFTPPPPAWVPPSEDALNFDSTGHSKPPEPHETLSELEETVHSPHVQTPDVSEARDEVLKALDGSSPTPKPIEALNAQPLGGELHPAADAVAPTQVAPTFTDALQQAIPANPPATTIAPSPAQPTSQSFAPTPPANVAAGSDDELAAQLPGISSASFESPPQAESSVVDPTAAPPVPPPIPFRFGNTTEPPQTA